MRWVKLTRREGEPLWVVAAQIESVTTVFEPTARAQVTMVSGQHWFVEETAIEVMALTSESDE